MWELLRGLVMKVEHFRQANVVAWLGALTAFFLGVGVSLALDEIGIGTVVSLGIAGGVYAVAFALACQQKVPGIEDVVTGDSNYAEGAGIVLTTTYRRTGDPALDSYIDTYVSCRKVALHLLGGVLFLVLIIGVLGGLKYLF